MSNKKSLRDDFRKSVFERDGFKCVMCGYMPDDVGELDAHHITDRSFIVNGGYCKENGITLCTDRCVKKPWLGTTLDCHQKAEWYHAHGNAVSGYSPVELYARIHSSCRTAYQYSLSLTLPEPQVSLIMGKIQRVSAHEILVCAQVNDSKSETTWELACGDLHEDDPFVLAYGAGRYVDS